MLFGKRKERKLSEKEMSDASSIALSIRDEREKNYSVDDIVLAEEKAEKYYKGKKALRKIWDKIQVLFFIARHPKVWGLPVAIPASVAVLYLVLPVDAIPDIIAGLGLIDDVFVITTSIGAIIKAVSLYSREKLLEIRSLCPENIIPAFDEMFSINKAEEGRKVEEEPVIPPGRVEKTAASIEKGLKGTKKIISGLAESMEEKAASKPSVRSSKLYRMISRADRVSKAVVLEGEKIALITLEEYLDSVLMKKWIRSLISMIMFVLSLFFFSLQDSSFFFLILSALCMLFSYTFFIVSSIKSVPRIICFIRGYIKGGLEEAVVSLVFRNAESDRGLKEALVKCGVKRVTKDRALISLLLRNFGKTLLSFLIRMILIIVAFFALKKVVLLFSGLHSSMEILFAPVVEIFYICSGE